MPGLIGGAYQQLLLQSADNGRLLAHHRRPEARSAAARDEDARQVDRNGNNRREDSNGASPLQGSASAAPRHPKQIQLPAFSPFSLPSLPRPQLPSASRPAAASMIPPEWRTRRSALVIVKPIPSDATPWDIRQFFQTFGNVVWVELDEASIVRSAKIRFEPPPTDPSFFQEGRCRLNVGGSWSWACVEFPRQAPEEPTLETPLGNACPFSITLNPDKLTFGLLTQPTAFMCKREVPRRDGDFALKFTADFRRNKLILHFPVLVGREKQYYRIDVRFGIVRAVYRMTMGEGHAVVIVALEDPPLVRKKEAGADGEAWADRLVWGEDELWHRAVEVKSESQDPQAWPVSLEEKPNIIDFGRWTTYWIDLDKSGDERWAAVETHLRDWNIHTKLDSNFTQTSDRSPTVWDMLSDVSNPQSKEADRSWRDDLALLSQTAQVSLPYDVRYQLEVCISRGILSEYNIGRDFLERLAELSKPDSLSPNRARLMLEYAADQGKPIYQPMDLFRNRAAMTYYPTTLHIPEYCTLMRKVTVTPTRIYFGTPTVETTNRIIRRYQQVQDHFIRVQFTDELMEGRIRACDVDRDDELYTRVYRVMMQGIRMGKWHWRFLAFGNSQIRENGAFFFCQPEGHRDHTISCDSIREWMGNFSKISSVAKLAARLGQCFSTTRLLHCISSPQIVKIPDVRNADCCFTDGVGKISTPLASLISQDWKIHPPPSAFQFRMGGCKGVLVTWPEAKGTQVHVRPSQEKFHAEYNGLEIIRCAQFSSATLNRQTILILSCLGVPDDVFVGLMRRQISDYDAAMRDPDKAVELLNSHVDENMTTPAIASMILSGFMHTREPFVRTLLQLWRSWSIKALKEKARIVVDQGAFVLGCVDETGTLRGHSRATEGRTKIARDQLPQIFLQVPDTKDRGAYKVITGLCVVGRNPSLHPGDIRVVEAVDVPQLRHLRDVVVFPIKGDRDVPSMLSGGDLDGDDFFVIWDPRLLPPEWSHPPMNYTAPEPLAEPKASTAKSLATFFVLFMKNDRLPLIAHAHLATADHEVEGAKHRKCLQLAELHSTAVDYVKTGIPAVWNKKLDSRRYPHFMEKPRRKSYHSTSVLGKLYDMVDKEVFDNRDNYRLPFDSRILSRYQLNNAWLKEARRIKTQYDIAMRRVMGQLEIRTEFEVWTTFVLSKPRVGTDYKVQEKVGREVAGLKKQFRDLCLRVIEEQKIDRLVFVAAMYKVTWEETRIALYEARQQHVRPDGTVGVRRVTARSMPLISFPWLFANELGRIALGAEKLPGFSLRSQFNNSNSSNNNNCGDVNTRNSRPSTDGNIWDSNHNVLPKLDTEFDLSLAGVDYTWTSDGQVIHRGEVLHLFRHDDDDGEGELICDGGGAASFLSPESPTTDLDPEGAQETGEGRATGEMGSAEDFPWLVDLRAVIEERSGLESVSGRGDAGGAPLVSEGVLPVRGLTLDGNIQNAPSSWRTPAPVPPTTSAAAFTGGMTEKDGMNGKRNLAAMVDTFSPNAEDGDKDDDTGKLYSSYSLFNYSTPSMAAGDRAEGGAKRGTGSFGGSQVPPIGVMYEDGKPENGKVEDGDEEIEYEEEVIEIEGETALERFGRFA